MLGISLGTKLGVWLGTLLGERLKLGKLLGTELGCDDKDGELLGTSLGAALGSPHSTDVTSQGISMLYTQNFPPKSNSFPSHARQSTVLKPAAK